MLSNEQVANEFEKISNSIAEARARLRVLTPNIPRKYKDEFDELSQWLQDANGNSNILDIYIRSTPDVHKE